MSSIDYKALKKLADLCRKAGIKSYKNADFEFTLTDDAPVSGYKKREAKKQPTQSLDEEFQSDSLSPDELLMWSAQGIPNEEGNS